MRLVLFFFLFFYANSALALSCLNDYAGAAGCAANVSAAGDCETLGFAKTDVADCTHYLYCPFDIAYKRCVSANTKSCAELGYTQDDKTTWCGTIVKCPENDKYTLCASAYENPCPAGYDSRLASISDCGSQGSNGWTFDKQLIPGIGGETIICGRCTANTCSGYYATYQSLSDCGSASVTDKSGWKFSTCYAGEEKRGKCDSYLSCASRGYDTSSSVNNGYKICKQVSVYLGDSLSTCYDCAACNTSTTYPSFIDKKDIGSQGGITYCYNHSSYTGAYGSTVYTGTFKDYYGRTATKCVVMTTQNDGQRGVSCSGCCKSGSVATSDCRWNWKQKHCDNIDDYL